MQRNSNKRGSTLMLVLVMLTVILIVIAFITNYLVGTNKHNEKFNKNNDVENASKSALNIGKSEILNYLESKKGKVSSINELIKEYVLTEKVKDIVGEDGFDYDVKAILDEENSTYKIISIVTDKTGVSFEESKKIRIDLNPTSDIASLIPKFNIVSCLGTDVPSVKITTANDIGNPSSIQTDIWYVESLETDLNNKDYIGIYNNKYGETFTNNYEEGDKKIEIKEINNTKKGQWTNDIEGLIDNIDDSEEIYAQDGSGDIIGYRKKIEDSKVGDIYVILINGTFNLDRTYTDSYTFKRTILYATDSINIDFQDLRMDNSTFIAGNNITLKLRSFKQLSYIYYESVSDIQKFIRDHIS